MYEIDRKGGGREGGSKNRSLGQTLYIDTEYCIILYILL